nr:reverse transcriptase domain-containing protein [Tanacetum cinerariifolium]
MIKVLPLKTAEEVVAREKERKARTTLLMVLPEDHLAKFHKMADAKEMNKPGLDTLSFDDLYNNLRVFEHDLKGTTASSSSNTQNVAFMSGDNTSSTNDVSTAYSVSSPSVLKSQKEGSVSYTNEFIHSFFANQSNAPQLDCDDLEQINDNVLEEMDLKWQDIYWSRHVEEDTQNFAMMAYSSSNSGSDNEVQSYSKACVDSYARLKKFYDKQRDKLGDASVEIIAYTLALKRIGYGDYRYGSILSYKNEVLQSVFMNKECDQENTPANDRYPKGMHTVPPPMTGNYMSSRPDVEIDYSKSTYGPKQTSADESDSKPVEDASSDSNFCVEPSTSTDAPIIEEYESDRDDDSVSNVQENIEKPSFGFINSVKHVKSPKENVKEIGTPNHYPKIETKDRYSHTRKGLGYDRKSCFVCGSFSYLIKDCDFHEKRMAKQAALTNNKEKAQRTTFSYNKVNTVNTSLSAVKGNGDTTVKASAEFKGGFVAFGCSYGRITGKGKIKAGRSTEANNSVGTQDNDDQGDKIGKNEKPVSQVEQIFQEELKKLKRQEKEANDAVRKEATHETQDVNTNKTNLLNVVSTQVGAIGPLRDLNDVEPLYPDDPLIPHLKDIYASSSAGIFTNSSYDDEVVVIDFNNLEITVNVRSKVHKNFEAHALWNPKTSLKHWKIKVGLMLCKRNYCSSKFRRKEERIDYDEVFAPVEGIEVIRIFLAFASYMGFIVYQMDVKSAFWYGTIDEEVYVTQPPIFVDPKFPNDMNGYYKNHEKRAKNRAITYTRTERCMRTRYSYFPNNSSATIPRRRNKRHIKDVVEPELRTIVEMADNRTMEELLQASTKGYGEAIVIPKMNADHFEIKTNLLQLVQANPYHGFERENPHTYINNFNRITLTLKFRDVPNDVIKLMMFSYSLERNSRLWMNMTSSDNASKSDDRIDKLADQISTLVDIFAKKIVTLAPVKEVMESCVTCGGQGNNFNRGNNFQPFQVSNQGFQNPPFQVPNNLIQQGFPNEFLNYKKVIDQMMRNMQNQINSLKGEFKNEIQNTMKTQQIVLMEQQSAFQNKLQNMLSGFFQNQSMTSGTFPSNTIPNPKGEIKTITTRSGVAYEGHSIPTPKKVVEQETKKITDKEQSNFRGSNAHIQPPAMLLKKLPEKLRDPGKFLIPCDFPGMDVCHALADLGERMNLMPLFIWKKLSLPELTPTRMNLELADSRASCILGKSFLRTDCALIEVYGEEITLQTGVCSRNSCFSSNSSGGSPTLNFEHILSDSSPSITIFEGSNFILEEIEAYLKDDSISPEIDPANFDLEGDIYLIEKLLNDDPL